MKIQLLVFFLFIWMHLGAQTYIDIPWREGMVTKDGKELTGMIRLGGDLGAPWLNHSKVYFVTNEAYLAAKKHPGKKDLEEYEPEDIQGYSTYTIDKDGARIEMNFVSGEIVFMDGLAKKKQIVFLQQLEKGPVSIYRFIPMADNYSDSQAQYEAGQRAINQSIVYLRKGETDYVEAADIEVKDLLVECTEVVNKIKAGNYGFVDLSERPKKKGLGNLMANQAGNNALEEMICQAVSDYNQCMK